MARRLPIALPANVRVSAPDCSADGTMFAFTNDTADRVELWVGNVATGKAHLLPGLRINPLLHGAVQCDARPEDAVGEARARQSRHAAGAPAPPGPKVQESSGPVTPSSTYEARDLLKTPYDADLFDFYTTSQLALVDAASGKVTLLGKPAIYEHVGPAPGGQYLLVERMHRPYSYQRPYERFPKDVEVWNTDGKLVETVASLPLAEKVPIDGVAPGPRYHDWQASQPATLVWVEARRGKSEDQGPLSYRLMAKPVGGTAKELCKTEQRLVGLNWIETGGLASDRTGPRPTLDWHLLSQHRRSQQTASTGVGHERKRKV